MQKKDSRERVSNFVWFADNTNLQLSRLPFPFSAFYESAPAQLIQVSPDALKFSASVFQVAYNSGSGSVTNQKVVLVGSGCNASDFLAFPAGSVDVITD